MKRLVLLALLTSNLYGASVVIDCGATTDSFFTGGTPFAVPGAGDTTIRFGTFSYQVPLADGPYIVMLNFAEPTNVPPARVFSVTVNDQVVLARMTTPGYLAPITRSFLAWASGGFINIRFDTIIRSAVVSSISIEPLYVTGIPRQERVTGAVPVWNQMYYVPRPITVVDPNTALVYTNVEVFRNGLRLMEGPDYTVSAAMYQLRIQTSTGQAWPATDKILVDYTATFPFIFPIVTEMATCRGSGPTWNCEGLQLFRFKLPDGTIDGPYIATKMPPGYVVDPDLWGTR